MGVSPMIWIVLLGGAAVLWWSKNRKVSLPAAVARPMAPTGAAQAIPQSTPTPISASAQPADVVQTGNVPGSIWV